MGKSKTRQREECEREPGLIQERNSQGGAIPTKEISPECDLVRLVEEDYTHDIGEETHPLPRSFEDNRLSVFVIGEGFDGPSEEWLLGEITESHRAVNGRRFIGARVFKASTALNTHQVIHDPNPTLPQTKEDGTTVPPKDQHPSHAQVICLKDPIFGIKIRDNSTWLVSPEKVKETLGVPKLDTEATTE